MIDPGEFIKVAEKSGLVFPLGSWVLKAACERVHEFNEAGFDVPVAVNVSPTQFEQADFAQKVLDAIQSCRIKAEHLQLEISEEALMVDQRRTLEHFRRLKRAGVRIAVDDFGTGQSNLSYLGRMRLDIVKIDRSFVESLQESGDDWGRRTIGAVLALAKSLEYETVAVGVETEAQLKFLRDGGCDRVQGYLIGQPMPVGEFLNWLTSRHTESDGAESFYREASAG
jgi:EAL domain-containing protein (putative c-di-GMP-specific phosphodiesterase class I)